MPLQPTDATDATQTPGWLAPRLNALGQAINDLAQLKPKAAGLATLSSSVVTVYTSAVTASSVILLTVNSIGANSNVGFPVVTDRTPGVSFTIATQTNPLNDDDVIGWVII